MGFRTILAAAVFLAVAACDDDWRKLDAPAAAFEIREVTDRGALLGALAAVPSCNDVEVWTEPRGGVDVPYAASKDRALLDRCVSQAKPRGVHIAVGHDPPHFRTYTLKPDTIISGRDLERARVAKFDDAFYLEVQLSEEAAEHLGDFTRSHVGQRFAILIQGNVEATPEIVAALESESLKLRVTSREAGEASLAELSGR